MLPLRFARLALLRNILVDQVRAPHLTPYQQRDAMQRKVKNLSVLSPLPHGFVQGLSGKDLTNHMGGIRRFFVGYPRGVCVKRGQLVPVALKEPLKSGIRKFDRALPVKNDDSQRAILYERIQICGLSMKINGQAVSLADLGSHDESYCGQHHHQKGYFVKHDCGRREQMHRDDDSKIHDEQAGDNSPDSLTYRNPDDRNKTQIKMIVMLAPVSENYEEDDEYRQRLARGFCDPTKSEFRYGVTRSGGAELRACWREPTTNMRKQMDKKKRCDAQHADGVTQKPP